MLLATNNSQITFKDSKSIIFKLFSAIALIAALLFLSSCASIGNMYIHGGSIESSSYPIEDLQITYESENEEMESTYHLIKNKGKLAILEESQGQYVVIIDHNRTTEAGDHFVTWIKGAIFGAPGPAGEFIVPYDRKKPAFYYWYPPGTYTIEVNDGVMHPVPFEEQEPFTKLFPKTTTNNLDNDHGSENEK